MASSHIDLITERKQKIFLLTTLQAKKKNVFLVPYQKLELSEDLTTAPLQRF